MTFFMEEQKLMWPEKEASNVGEVFVVQSLVDILCIFWRCRPFPIFRGLIRFLCPLKMGKGRQRQTNLMVHFREVIDRISFLPDPMPWQNDAHYKGIQGYLWNWDYWRPQPSLQKRLYREKSVPFPVTVDEVGLLFTILVAKSKGMRLILWSSPYMYKLWILRHSVLCLVIIELLLFLLCFVQLERASVTLWIWISTVEVKG